LKDPNSLHTPVTLPTCPSVSSSGLVDSGSSHCFVDPSFISQYDLPFYEIPPVTLRLLDGSVGAIITSAADILIRFTTGDILLLKFYVTKLDSVSALVFGYDWLHRYNPSIDWTAGLISHFRQLPHPLPSSSRSGLTGSEEPPAASIPSASNPLTSVTIAPSAFTSSPSVPVSSSFSSSKPPSVSFINAAAYARLARMPGTTVFSLSLC
jgi:hypothetical protein